MRHDPQATLEQLCELFPEFSGWLIDEEVEDGIVDGVHLDRDHHHVMMEFTGYFARNHRAFDERQLRAFAAWIDHSLAAGGDLGEAVRSCFLGHTREVHVALVLEPYLSKRARAALA